MVNCPLCNKKLKLTNTDSRQEWTEEFYSCEECEKEFVLRTEYETQSNIISNQELTEL